MADLASKTRCTEPDCPNGAIFDGAKCPLHTGQTLGLAPTFKPKRPVNPNEANWRAGRRRAKMAAASRRRNRR